MDTTVALVGIGGYGEIYVTELLENNLEKGVRLVAGIDPNPERCTQMDDLVRAKVPIFPDLDSFYRQTTADLVIISAPIHLHAPLTCLALSKGSHVLCEKPLGATMADANLMLNAERRSGKYVAIGYQWSFSDSILALKRDILAGRFGRPLHFKTAVLWPRWRSYYQRNTWAGKLRLENGDWVMDSPMNNAAAHYLHNMLFLLGDSIDTSARPLRLEAELYRANLIENHDTTAMRVYVKDDVDLLFLTAHPVKHERGPLIQYEFEDCVIEYPAEGRIFKALMYNGQSVSYGSPDANNANKLWQAVETVRTGEPPVCGLRASLPQLVCVSGAQQTPIYDFPQALIQLDEAGGDQLTYVDGLFENLLSCYETGLMPSENKNILWTGRKTTINLSEIHYD